MSLEIAKLIPVILSVEPGPQPKASGSDSVEWRVWHLDGTTYLAAVNPTRSEASVALEFPTPVASAEVLVGEARGRDLAGAQLKLDLDPIETLVLKVAVR